MKQTARYVLKSPAETEALAKEVSETLEGGTIVGLSGELGSGKSVFARAAAAALGVTDRMPSPTYTIVEEYTGHKDVPILHIDLYRLGDGEEFHMLGLEEVLSKSVSLIEWIDRAPDLVDRADLSVHFDHSPDDPDTRIITIVRVSHNEDDVP